MTVWNYLLAKSVATVLFVNFAKKWHHFSLSISLQESQMKVFYGNFANFAINFANPLGFPNGPITEQDTVLQQTLQQQNSYSATAKMTEPSAISERLCCNNHPPILTMPERTPAPNHVGR